mmetsp:Transcript_132107/g.313126  ORF Transcript_132107/g.313126 Transcript_132107/m.313126 type:complete len:267 (-) Transcript_132107:1684-2484(-)
MPGYPAPAFHLQTAARPVRSHPLPLLLELLLAPATLPPSSLARNSFPGPCSQCPRSAIRSSLRALRRQQLLPVLPQLLWLRRPGAPLLWLLRLQLSLLLAGLPRLPHPRLELAHAQPPQQQPLQLQALQLQPCAQPPTPLSLPTGPVPGQDPGNSHEFPSELEPALPLDSDCGFPEADPRGLDSQQPSDPNARRSAASTHRASHGVPHRLWRHAAPSSCSHFAHKCLQSPFRSLRPHRCNLPQTPPPSSSKSLAAWQGPRRRSERP